MDISKVWRESFVTFSRCRREQSSCSRLVRGFNLRLMIVTSRDTM
jgi:hypothetical protein